MKILPSEHPEVKRRRELCFACKMLVLNPVVKAFMGNNGVQCDICKCFVMLKTKLENYHCPIQKW